MSKSFSKLFSVTLVLALMLSMLSVTQTASAAPVVIAFEDFDGGAINLSGTANVFDYGSGGGAGGDVFGRVDGQTGGTGMPYDVADDTVADVSGARTGSAYPSDTLALAGQNTTAFFAMNDMDAVAVNNAVWTFDISSASSISDITIDIGALGDFESASSDGFKIEARIDAASYQTIFEATTDESAFKSYRALDNGYVFSDDDPLQLFIDGSGTAVGYLDKSDAATGNFDTYTSTLLAGQSGSTLDIRVSWSGTPSGSEPMGLDNITIYGEGGGVGTPPGLSLPISEGFDDCTLSDWEIISVDADTSHTWSCNSYYSNIEANGYGDSAPADEWLITPALNMDAQENDKLKFRSYTRYTDVNYPQLRVLYSTDYAGGGAPTSATWTELTGIVFSPEDSGSWTASGDVDLSGISGTNVYFAFHYVSSGTGSGTAATWRLDEINFFAPPPIVDAKIHEVQGSGGSVAISSNVRVDAIVVADYQNSDQLRGFFIQEEDADVDGDANTSEGIFVYCGDCSTDVAVGDQVEVVGQAEDYYGMSQIDATGGSVSILSNGNTLPTPATIDLPASGSTKAEATFENVEGMLVTFTDTLYVSEYFELARYGQLVLTADARPQQFTDAYEPSVAGYTAFLDDLGSKRIILDDDNNIQNDAIVGGADEPFFWPRPGLSNTNYIRGGDSISGLTGVLHWSYAGQSGTDAWRVRPVDGAFTYDFTSNNERTSEPADVGGSVKVASFNVLNYFTTINSRGADSVAELDRQREKTAAAICAIDADIVGLIEIENNGAVAISDLLDGTNGINANCGPYAFIDTGVIGTDEITVAFIYKTSTAAPLGSFAILDSSVDARFIDTKNRPGLAQTFVDTSTGGVFTVVVNHLKSKGSDCDALGDPDALDGQANCNLTRTAAAAAMVDWLATDPTGSDDPDFLIIGDLNSYRNEDPIDAIEAGADDTAGNSDDFTDLLDSLVGSSAYSYVFDGQLGYLDHALAGSHLVGEVSDITVWHINADEIPVFDYNDDIDDGSNEASYERESSALPIYEANAYRSSDHDPVIIGLGLTTEAEIQELLDDVQKLLDDGVLNGGQANALSTKLNHALEKLADGKAKVAANQLDAFINQVEDFVADGVLTAEQGDAFIKSAMLLVDALQ